MSSQFDPEAIRKQIANLVSDRDRIAHAINALEMALQSIEGVRLDQGQFEISSESLTLHDAVKQACSELRDGITRQRVIGAIERRHPFFKPKSPSVAASLISLTKGDQPMLRVAIEGRGRSPSLYSTEGETTHELSAEEIKTLMDPANTRGIGGWQSLFNSLQRQLDKPTGTIILTAEHRARIYQYCHHGGGGWQDKTKRIFRRELPHLFLS